MAGTGRRPEPAEGRLLGRQANGRYSQIPTETRQTASGPDFAVQQEVRIARVLEGQLADTDYRSFAVMACEEATGAKTIERVMRYASSIRSKISSMLVSQVPPPFVGRAWSSRGLGRREGIHSGSSCSER